MEAKLVKITGLKKSEMNAVVKEVTGESNYKWYCKLDKPNNIIILGNDYFSDNEYYEIISPEVGFVSAKLSYYSDTSVSGLLIDPTSSYADYDKWCIEAFRKLVTKCYKHFNYYV